MGAAECSPARSRAETFDSLDKSKPEVRESLPFPLPAEISSRVPDEVEPPPTPPPLPLDNIPMPPRSPSSGTEESDGSYTYTYSSLDADSRPRERDEFYSDGFMDGYA